MPTRLFATLETSNAKGNVQKPFDLFIISWVWLVDLGSCSFQVRAETSQTTTSSFHHDVKEALACDFSSVGVLGPLEAML